MRWWLILLILTVALAAAFFAACYLSFVYTFKRRKNEISFYKGLDGNDDNGKKAFSRELIDELLAKEPTKEVYVTSFDGLKLHAYLYENDKKAPFEIACHGYRSRAMRDYSGGARECFLRGHNLLLIDERAHGKSEGKVISFGILERLDICAWAEYIEREYPENKIILAGVSMGAASVLMASELSLPKNVVGIVADSPYSSPCEIIRMVSAKKGIPWVLAYPLVRLGALIFGRFNLEESSPVSAVVNSQVPILIIHGEDDFFVPCKMSEEIKSASKSVSLETFPSARHGLSYVVDRDRYAKITNGFINKILREKENI